MELKSEHRQAILNMIEESYNKKESYNHLLNELKSKNEPHGFVEVMIWDNNLRIETLQQAIISNYIDY